MIRLNSKLRGAVALLTLLLVATVAARAQSADAPLTSQELVRLVYQLPKHPEKRDEIVEEIRRRGIGFPLTEGLRGVVASKSGNDALLRRTLEEAERRRLNPAGSTLPPAAEAAELIEKARAESIAAAQAMPDFIVRQQITRSRALRNTENWRVLDRLSIAVSYRASRGEEYKLLAVNGLPISDQTRESDNYEQLGGTTSSGEYVTLLASLFHPDTRAEFRPVDTDTLRGRRTIVYEYEVKLKYSRQSIKADGEQSVNTGYRGRIWVDRENYRVLRLENISTDIPAGFPVTAASSRVDYDWVTINERQYLLPSNAEIRMTRGLGDEAIQSRNEIRFRNYQKFGAEVKIIEDVEDFEDEPEPEKKP